MVSLYPQQWLAYLSIIRIFVRLLGLFLLVPGFSHQAIPGRVRILIGLSLSLALAPMLLPKLGALPEGVGGLVGVVMKETVIGLIMGFAVYATFEGLNLGAQFIGTQMGFGAAGLVDPVNHASTSVLVPLQSWIVLLLFFLLDFHHSFLELFVKSFDLTLLSDWGNLSHKEVLAQFIKVTTKVFVLGVQMAAPFTLIALACNVAMSVLSRVLPQMNIFLFSFPITILIGLCAMYVFAPELMNFVESILGDTTSDAVALLRTL